MSASDGQVQDPVLATTDPVISHEVPVPVDGQILKDVSNLGSNETPESVAGGLVSLYKTDASNGTVGHTTTADGKENAASHEQPASLEDGVFVDDKEVIIHGSDIALEKTEDVQDASAVQVDNAASDSITTDNVDDTTLNETDNEIIAVKDIPNTSKVESVPAVEYGTPADSDLIAPVANSPEANTIDDSVNDPAIEIPALVLEKKQVCAKDDEDDAAPADGVRLVETGNHNEAVQMDKRDATDNVDDYPDIMNQAPNGESLAAEVALQEKANVVNVDVDIASSAAEGEALDIHAVPETKEENASIAVAEAPESNVTDNVVPQVDTVDVVETQEDEAKVTVEGSVKQTQGEDAPAVAEDQVPMVEAAPTEVELKEDGVVVATETDESKDAEVATEEIEQGGVDETSTEHMNNLDAEPLVEEVEVGHEVELAAEDVNNIKEASSHEELVRSAVEEEPKVTGVAVRVIEEILDTGEQVAVDETTEAPETVEEPTTHDTEASISTSSDANIAPEVEVTYEEDRPAPEVDPVVANATITAPLDKVPPIPEEEPVDAVAEVEVEASLEEVSAPVDGESVPASEEITAPVDASDTVHEAVSVPVEEETVPASAIIPEPITASEDVGTVTPETINEKASAKVEVEPVTADEVVIAVPVDEPVTTKTVALVDNEEASVQVETEPITTTVDEPTATVAESFVPREGAAVCVEAEPLPAGEVITAPKTSVEEAPITIEVQYEVENIAKRAMEETTASVLAEPVAETGITEKASEVKTAGHDGVAQEAPGSVEPESIPASDEVATTVVEVTEEPVLAPIELTSTTTVKIENKEIPVPVDALDETTAESALIEAPVDVTVPPSLKAEQDVTGDTTSIVVADDEATLEEVSTFVKTESVTASGNITTFIADEAAPPSIHAPNADNDMIVEAQTHTETPALDTEPSSVVTEGEAVAEETPASAVETTQEAFATLETGSKSPPPIVEAENAGISQGAESVPQTDEGASVPIAPLAAEIAPIEIAREFTVDEEERAVVVEESTNAPVVEGKENVPEVRTGTISIETSLDTTPFTPILDSGIGFKEQEPASSPLSSIAEGFERLKSSWPSSFQVSTIGGVESSGVGDAEPVPESKELTETDELAGVPFLVVEDTHVNEQVPMIGASEVSEEVTGGLEVDEEDSNENVDQEANQEVEAKLIVDDAPARSWTPSYSIHSQGTPLVATKELEDDPPESVVTDAALSAERSVENHAENAVTVDSEHDNTVDEQINTTKNEVYGQLSTEVSHANPVIALEGHEIEDKTLNQAETDPNLENELPSGPWTPSYAVYSQGSPVAIPKELEEASPLNTKPSILESTVATSLPIDARENNHSEPLTAEVDKSETPGSVEQSQNNSIGKVVAAAIAPVIALAALGAGSQGSVSVVDDEATQVDATLIVDTTAVPLLSVTSEVVDGGATDTDVDALERPRSPWTPSYSVTKQGASLSQEERTEVDHLEPLSPVVAQVVTTDSEPQLNEVQEDDSASNGLQTRPSYAVTGTEEIAKNEQFFLFGLRAIVAYLWVLPKWLSMAPSDHSRRGSSSSSSSSSSSKFFPGGWFTPKPNEGHTSLDVAQGEFASSPKVTTSNDVFETLGPEATNSSAAVNVAAEDYGQKRKWCVVM